MLLQCQLSAGAAGSAAARLARQQLQCRLLTTQGVVGLSATAPNAGSAQPVWPAALVRQAQLLAAAAGPPALAAVMGHTTPNVADVGGASLRLRFADPLAEGGYLLCVRPTQSSQWLPAIAGVPGERGPDDHGNFRPGLAELMVLGRPVHESPHELTIVPHATLAQAFPAGAELEVVVIERVTDFFLGLNAGQWLKIRIAQISDGGLAYLRSTAAEDVETTAAEVLAGTGLQSTGINEPPPTDASYLHHFYGNFASTTNCNNICQNNFEVSIENAEIMDNYP